jgi:hypothetical protein
VGLTEEQRKRLEDVVRRRVGVRSDAEQLTTAYLNAMLRNAYVRTTEPGPVPTSLTAERSAILIELSRELGRVVEDFEIQALFRVTLGQARAMRTMLLATYSDDADDLTLAWSLRGAHTGPRRRGETFSGTVIVFGAEDRRDAFVAHVEREGIDVEVILGDDSAPWQVLVGDAFPRDQLPHPASG